MQRLDPVNTTFIAVAHLLAAVAVVYLAAVHFSWWTVGLGILWIWLCGLSITAGYHRLFAHRTYECAAVMRAFFLFFGAASVQNSALRWAADHRVHHRSTDTDEDPYSVRRGFWWAHIGWVLSKAKARDERTLVNDLHRDRLVSLQHRYYVPVAAVSAAALPAGLGLLWGDPLGALLVAGFLRLVVQWHCTFSINSVAHLFGRRPYARDASARDSHLTALFSFGEGYHNYHHTFHGDYRNGVRWYHFDPAKWLIWTASHLRLAWNLRRAPAQAIQRARDAVRAGALDLARNATRTPTNAL